MPTSVDWVKDDLSHMVAAYTNADCVIYDIETGNPVIKLDTMSVSLFFFSYDLWTIEARIKRKHVILSHSSCMRSESASGGKISLPSLSYHSVFKSILDRNVRAATGGKALAAAARQWSGHHYGVLACKKSTMAALNTCTVMDSHGCGDFIWLQLIFGLKPCFLSPSQLARQIVNISECPPPPFLGGNSHMVKCLQDEKGTTFENWVFDKFPDTA